MYSTVTGICKMVMTGRQLGSLTSDIGISFSTVGSAGLLACSSALDTMALELAAAWSLARLVSAVVQPLLLMVSCFRSSGAQPPRLASCQLWRPQSAVPRFPGAPLLVRRAQDVLESVSCSRALGSGFVNLAASFALQREFQSRDYRLLLIAPTSLATDRPNHTPWLHLERSFKL